MSTYEELRQRHLADAAVIGLDRQATGKLKRFVPCPAPGVPGG